MDILVARHFGGAEVIAVERGGCVCVATVDVNVIQ
jgi:hypothetical protein